MHAGVFPGVRQIERSRRSAAAGPWSHVDWILVGACGALLVLGVVMVYSASRSRLVEQGLSGTFLLQRQIVFIVLAVALALVVNLFDYTRWKAWVPGLYFAFLASLLLVLTPLGTEVNGARGWFEIGAFQIQPAEYGKPIMVLVLASVASQGEGRLDRRRLLQLLVLAGAPMALLILQPDLGSVMVYVFLLLAVLLIGGAKPRHIGTLAAAGAIAVIFALQLGIIKDYQQARLSCFLNAEENVRAECYNIRQSGIAIGSGGLTGKGLFQGTQTKGNFIPEQHNDFIFTAIGEELGFLGAVAVIALIGIIVWRGVRAVQLSRDFFGSLLAVGVTAVVAFQSFLNIAVTIGVMPVTGVTLPFVSYGGSSILSLGVLLGLLVNVH
ncbi:MAG: rod shape-determining protein RodA, partial [Actinobacteria bacterium ATB1]|nr:rod shape-determining protein RodA [Actinobacteria bacterium ATB1]